MKIYFLPQMFLCTHIYCIFDNLNHKLWLRLKTFAQCPILLLNHSFFNKFFSSKWSHGHVKFRFDNRIKQCWQKANFFCSNFKIVERMKLHQKLFSSNCSHGHIESIFGKNSTKCYWSKVKIFPSRSKKKKSFSSFKFFFLELQIDPMDT